MHRSAKKLATVRTAIACAELRTEAIDWIARKESCWISSLMMMPTLRVSCVYILASNQRLLKKLFLDGLVVCLGRFELIHRLFWSPWSAAFVSPETVRQIRIW